MKSDSLDVTGKVIQRRKVMDQGLYEEALHSEVLSGKLVDTLKEGLSYSSISFINDTIDVLETIRKRIERGDTILLEESGGRLNAKSFQEFVKENFSAYISSEVFTVEGRPGKEKVYFRLEACEGGYSLILNKDGKAKTYEWISSLSEKFSLVYMISTGIVYVKDVRKGVYSPFISEHGRYCRYDKELGKILEV